MRITIKEGEKLSLVWLNLLSPSRLNSAIDEIITGVTCLLLLDAEQHWLGMRLLPVNLAGEPLFLPSALSCDYPLHNGYLRQNPDFIEINFVKGVRPVKFMELGCKVDILQGELFAIELSLPKEKVMMGKKFLESFITRS